MFNALLFLSSAFAQTDDSIGLDSRVEKKIGMDIEQFNADEIIAFNGLDLDFLDLLDEIKELNLYNIDDTENQETVQQLLSLLDGFIDKYYETVAKCPRVRPFLGPHLSYNHIRTSDEEFGRLDDNILLKRQQIKSRPRSSERF